MHVWGPSTYGQPCRGCGFSWATGEEDAITMVRDSPAAYTLVLGNAGGQERHPALAWSVAAYVCHVADNLRIWAERLGGIAAGAPPLVGDYDERALGEARNYGAIALPAAMWSLSRSVIEWADAVHAVAASTGVVIIHPERGGLSRADVVLSNAHDARHHQWDIERTLDHDAGERRSDETPGAPR